MSKQMTKENQVSRLRNDVALHAAISYTTARQLCVFLLTLAQVNPNAEGEKPKALLSVDDIARLVRKEGAKRSGSLQKEVVSFIEKMAEANYLKFKSGVKWQGVELPDIVTIYKRIKPIDVPAGNTMYEFTFNEDMLPYIQHLKKEYVTLPVPAGIKSGHSVRFFIMAKAHYDRNKEHHRGAIPMTVEVAEFKRILGVQYPKFKDFRVRVLEQIKADINNMGVLHISDMQYKRTGRKISHVIFMIQAGDLTPQQKDKPALKGQTEIDFAGAKEPNPKPTKKRKGDPTEKDIEKLTFAQLGAFDFLVANQLFESKAFAAIHEMPSSEFVGWEDVFVKIAWDIFSKGTKYKKPEAKAGAFVKWWHKGEFKQRHLGEIIDKVADVKKSKTPQERANREMAKKMKAEDFKKEVRAERKTTPQTNGKNSGFTDLQSQIQTLAENMKTG